MNNLPDLGNVFTISVIFKKIMRNLWKIGYKPIKIFPRSAVNADSQNSPNLVLLLFEGYVE